MADKNPLPREFQFTPTRVFTWVKELDDGNSVLMGEYHPGMTYNCPDRPTHAELRAKCAQWATEDDPRITIIPLKPGQFFRVTETQVEV